jgi:RHS repeat-associated protein
MNLGYTGKPYDVVTGLYDYGYRDYSPALARFTTVDPIRDGSNWFVYVNNDPVNWIDPWGLSANDGGRAQGNTGSAERLDSILNKINTLLSESENPVFTIGLSASATGPGISTGHSSGMFVIPKSKSDPIFYASMTAYINSLISQNPISKLASPLLLTSLISRSSDYGAFTDILSTGTGGGMAASAGLSIGIFKSYDDFKGFFIEVGGSAGVGIFSAGVDFVFNDVDLPVGLMVTTGVGFPASTPEGHVRFGNTFVLSAIEQIESQKK